MSDSRIEALESRLAALEKQFQDLLAQAGTLGDDIPWMPIAAAVAAVYPDMVITSIRPAPPHAASRWGLMGRLILLQSHGVR
ncbi:MAG: hypothetical protein SFU53_05450 [Terrimicrobiaceae bacterium]|nr:hypothetical protein [Terrimicrobiaceae bacterium]